MWTKEILTAILDAVVSLATYFTTAFLAPEWADHVLFVIGVLQPILLLLIGMFAKAKIEAIKAGVYGKISGL